ncbi:hypothetical protein ILUMI_03229 [Ignelater luminosus]|uniref:Cap-specific mRNA (nucleoside-2'-O-)-methyltransferase 1 n=1 Tax=Ignelater luminosus TaxID=2038154 RepID=A0A8K0DB68_IGNLU|nr:hypothetical protein ILUMI_03229 [Ignelater luminosus]
MSSFNSSEESEHLWNLTMSTTTMMYEDQNCYNPSNGEVISDKGLLMMAKMGYKKGTGLGKNKEGRLNPIDLPKHLGKRGFGFHIPHLESNDLLWDANLEAINIKEETQWISNTNCDLFINSLNDLSSWMIKGPKKLTIDDEIHFCDPSLLQQILSAKGKFDELDSNELTKARARSNPFETIRSAFFMNRAALKMANIDAVTGFIFTDIDRNPNHRKTKGPYYFADVCAGPGGFSEYILWRKKWLFKGFGFTLKGEHDFELTESQCASPVTFSAHYGIRGDGDVCCPDNIRHFAERVLHETDGMGVHFMMSDGGFSVEGNENLQEILSKQLYVCQCLTALAIVRPHGHFVTKLFDLFTPFSVGLIFIMYNCFEKISILKPNTSRPANSERYLICYGLKACSQTQQIQKYLWDIASELWELHQVQNNLNLDVNQIVPMSIITANKEFYNYIVDSNNRIGANQIVGLLKLTAFCQNPTLIEPRQEELRVGCLKYWQIPDIPKIPLPRFTTDDLLELAVNDSSFMYTSPKQSCDIKQLAKLLSDIKDWYYIISGCNKKTNICNFYAGVGGSRVYRLQRYKWVKVKHLKLIRGTLLYGEMVKETVAIQECEKLVQKHSLHVIDALRLGDTSLADLPFKERLDLIETYCQAVNHESQPDGVRVRVKMAYPIEELNSIQSLVVPGRNEENNYCILPTLGFNSIKEYYVANSILFLKIDQDQLFHSTFLSRIQVFIDDSNNAEEHLYHCNNKITLTSLVRSLMGNTSL